MEQSALMGYMPLILVFGVFYFLVLRPQSKQAQAHRAMLAALAKGDTVTTSGGMHGVITKVNDATITLNIAEGVDIVLDRTSVGALITKAPEVKSKLSKKSSKTKK